MLLDKNVYPLAHGPECSLRSYSVVMELWPEKATFLVFISDQIFNTSFKILLCLDNI